MQSPCYDTKHKIDCPKRHSGCSIDCKEWQDYAEQRNNEYLVRYYAYLIADAEYQRTKKEKRRRK